MPDDIIAGESVVDRWAREMSEGMATRFPRRSFLGKVGRYATAAVAGGTASVLLLQEPALAIGCGCGATHSVSCHCLTGSNTCPSNTCECGCWIACDTSRCPSPHSIQWCDCCNQRSPTSRCVARCSGLPANCFPKEWSGGCNPGHPIRCRKFSCLNHPTC
jgi:hypothetical protein